MPRATPSLDTIVADAIEFNNDTERANFLAEHCGGDTDLRSRAEALISAHFRAGRFLEVPAVAVAECEAFDEIGTSIGPYRLLEQIGEGGMGIVYVAEQTDPVRRRVALKVIKPGMDSKEVIARFETERQALALMEHSNIAKVFDGGATSAGRPYFVMELVRGLPITEYCDQAKLSPDRRLKLYVQVCRAVQHAHQKGVIHRDLKPSNVMITMHDGEPVPKVIDFGVAKAVGQRLTEHSAYTRLTQMIGTPLYMSPEQAELSALDVDTRSDVYSLGVLLYELLTGTTPFDAETLRQAGFDEMRRIIREDEPPRPSARVSTFDAAARSTVSSKRGLDERQLSRLLHGDLDWIVMKALEKDRNRRYESAGAFAADVERYLANEPVEARPPSALYRLKKFVRRNRAGVATGAVIAAAVLAVAATVGWQIRDVAIRKMSAEQVALAAQREADGFEQQRRWSEAAAAIDRAIAILESNNAGESIITSSRNRRNDLAFVLKLEQIRLEASAVKDDKFDLPRGQRAYAAAFQEYGAEPDALVPDDVARQLPGGLIRSEIVGALEDWARLRRGQDESIGPAAERLLSAADAADPDPWRKDVRRAWAESNRQRMKGLAAAAPIDLHPCTVFLLAKTLDDPEALRFLQEAQMRRPDDFWITHLLADRLRRSKPPRYAEALAFYRAALALQAASPGVWLNLGLVLGDLGRNDEAIEAIERAIDLKPDYGMALENLAIRLNRMKHHQRAETVARQHLANQPEDASAHHTLGNILYSKGDYEAAAAEFTEAARLEPAHELPRLYYGICLSRLGRHAESLAAYQTALQLNPNSAAVHNSLGGYYHDREKNYSGAIAAFRKAIELKPEYATAYANLGRALFSNRELDEAVVALREANRLDPEFPQAYSDLGLVFFSQRKFGEAVAAYEAVTRLNPQDAESQRRLGLALEQVGRVDDAIAAVKEAIRLKPKAADYRVSLANLLYSKRMFDEAISAFEAAARLNPQDAESRRGLGLALHQQKRMDDAIAALKEAIRLDSRVASFHYDLANMLNSTGQFSEAMNEFRQAIRLNPDYAEAHCNLGGVLQARGHYYEALKSFRRGHELGSKIPGWRYPSAQWVKKCEALIVIDEVVRWLSLGASMMR